MRVPALLSLVLLSAAGALPGSRFVQEPATAPRAFIDGTGPGWRTLGPGDFAGVNGNPDTWAWEGSLLKSTGVPIGVMRTRDTFTNFELVIEWRHLKAAGNSGVFAWVPMQALEGLPPNQLPRWGIEVQMLDHGYREYYAKRSGGKPANWFTTNGDIFAVGNSKLEPFEPRSPDGSRSFPRAERSRGVGEWNHYYVRGINGEIRLWVNGEEVSGAVARIRAPASSAWRPKDRRSNSATFGCETSLDVDDRPPARVTSDRSWRSRRSCP